MSNRVAIKAGDLKGQQVILMPGWVSNGYWMIAHAHVDNRAMFASKATTEAFAPGADSVVDRTEEATDWATRVLPKGELVELTATGLSFEARAGYKAKAYRVAVYHGACGFVGLRADWLALMCMESGSLWTSVDGNGPVVDAPQGEQATRALMQHSIGAEKAWLATPNVAVVSDGDTPIASQAGA